MTASTNPRHAGLNEEVVLKSIEALCADGIPPTLKELAEDLGVVSTSTVRHWVTKLEATGKVRRYPNVARGIVAVRS
jgi:SOS-response transcriptional repressor LexA